MKTIERSFRDPGGKTCIVDNRVFRVVNKEGIRDLQAFLSSCSSMDFVASDRLVGTSFPSVAALQELVKHEQICSILSNCEAAVIVEHDLIPFPTFPHEWPPEMLHAAASLTLDLAETLVCEELGLKDASPYNVLFRYSKPVFVDLLSFEKRDPTNPTWLPYSQFMRTFLLPLLLNKYFGISLAQLFATRRDGIEPEEVFRLLGPIQKFKPPFVSLVSIPTLLTRSRISDAAEIYRKRSLSDSKKATFIFRNILKNARRNLRRGAPVRGRESRWSNYSQENNYAPGYFAKKEQFVRELMSVYAPRNVLDVGCNTGELSLLAAQAGASVIAIDSDPIVVGEVWRRANEADLPILPLVVNLARPSPAIGWRNSECSSFLDRAKSRFDAVLMFGLLHHLLVSEQIPLPQIIELAAELTTNILAVEFIAPSDPKFKQIARGRDHLFANITKESFEHTCHEHFEILSCRHLEQTSRYLYLMRRKDALIECLETQQ